MTGTRAQVLAVEIPSLYRFDILYLLYLRGKETRMGNHTVCVCACVCVQQRGSLDVEAVEKLLLTILMI